MPSFDLLILPLLGGYLFLITSNFTRYLQHRLERQRLIFHSIISGFTLLFLAFIIAAIIRSSFPELSHFILGSLPIKQKFFGTCLLSFCLGIIIPLITNLIFPRRYAMDWAWKLLGDDFELLLRRAILSKELVMLSLKSRKIYVGWVTTISRPRPNNNYIGITPVISGFRDDKTLKILYTTDYISAYRKLIEKGQIENEEQISNEFVIKKDEIESAAIFQIELFENFEYKEIES